MPGTESIQEIFGQIVEASNAPAETDIVVPDVDNEGQTLNNDIEIEGLDPANETPSNELAIEFDDKSHKFKLDAADKDLSRTLKRGLLAPKLVRERDIKIKELNAQIKELTTVKTQADELGTLKAMIENGHTRQALKTLLGQEKFDKFLQASIYSRVKAELSEDDAVKAKIKQDEEAEDKQYADYTKEQEFSKREAALKAKEEVREAENHKSLAQAAFEKYSFKDLKLPPALERQFEKKLWDLARNDIVDFIDEYKEMNNGEEPQITYSTYAKAFKKNYTFLRERESFLGAQETKKKSEAQKTEVKKAKDIGAKKVEKAATVPTNKQSWNDLNISERFELIKARFK